MLDQVIDDTALQFEWDDLDKATPAVSATSTSWCGALVASTLR